MEIAEKYLLSFNNSSLTNVRRDNELSATVDAPTSDSLSERINGESDSSSDNTWKEVTIILFFIVSKYRNLRK